MNSIITVKGEGFLRLCSVCFQAFYPPQTFVSLFKASTVCPVCEALLSQEFLESELPVSGGLITLLSYAHAPHPAFTHKLFMRTLEGDTLLFLDRSVMRHPLIYRLLFTLLPSLVIVTPWALTLEEIAEMDL